MLKKRCKNLYRSFFCLLVVGLVAPALGAIYPAFVDGAFTLGDAVAPAPYGLINTFKLSSRPSATKTIFLDFDGFRSTGNSWGHNIQFPNYDLDGDNTVWSDGELEEIQKIFQNVAEDFLPFDVNVTTVDPGEAALRQLGTGDTEWGVRIVMTQATAGFGVGIGGDSGGVGFDDAADNPVFVFNKGNRKGGQTATHEAGHTFGLGHDGINGFERHNGTGGTGRTSWGPIMGAPFQVNLSQWSNGDYTGATNTADDFSFITSRGFGFRTDDYATSIASPHVLDAVNGLISDWGIIEQRTDVDHFQFTTGTGEVSIDLRVFAQDPNLDIAMTLYDSNGVFVADFDHTVVIDAFLDIHLEAGDYVFSVDGVGFPGRNSDYGSLGFYKIEIELPVFADLNSDNALDALDWQLFIANAESDLNGLTTVAAYQAGDLDGDGKNSLSDFGLFKEAYITANGLAAFQSLFVPEPTTMAMVSIALLGLARRNRSA